MIILIEENRIKIMLKVRIKSDPENDIKVEGDVGIEEDYLDSIPKGILSLIN